MDRIGPCGGPDLSSNLSGFIFNQWAISVDTKNLIKLTADYDADSL